jgi:hypothetical protein
VQNVTTGLWVLAGVLVFTVLEMIFSHQDVDENRDEINPALSEENVQSRAIQKLETAAKSKVKTVRPLVSTF